MKKSTWVFISLLATFLLGGIVSHQIHRRFYPTEGNTPTLTDTVYLYDTITKIKPVEKIVRVVDTFLVAITDTIYLNDSLYMPLPREQREYGDSTYRAWVSGYRPQLDSLHQFQTTKVITIYHEAKQTRWRIGMAFGATTGVFYTPAGWQPGLGAGYTLGIAYNF
jgi:hypothetical protein